MSDTITIARPYAKALFEHALATKQLSEWADVLQCLAQAILTPDAERFINNPASTIEHQLDLLQSVSSSLSLEINPETIQHFIRLLAENKRLLVLPDIYAQYDALRAEQEKTLAVQVSSFSTLTTEQQQRLAEMLNKRLQREIHLEVSIDETLLGGAVIQAGDLVIDGSVRGKLEKLATGLAA